ncbi:MAG: hypothetical protein Q8L78_07335 [Coxiellaceae bacterium]|nr:hypothetical protein [Coxiellaceae bacterium]
MRSAFIEPEKSLIQKIDDALCKLDRYKYIFIKNPKAKEALRAILVNARNTLIQVKETYKNLQSPEYTARLTVIWNDITTMTETFSQQLNEMSTSINYFASQIAPADASQIDGATRADLMGEFIANISTNRDGGASQRAVLMNICATVALNAHESITSLVPNDVIGDRESVTAWLHENRTLTRPHVQQALAQEVSRLTELEDPDIQRMWQNQEAAINDFTTQLLLLEQKTISTKNLQKEIVAAWVDYKKHTKQIKETDRQTALLTIILDTTQALIDYQKKIKLPSNCFALDVLINEIQFGQEILFKEFQKSQKKFQGLLEKINDLANASPPTSPTLSSTSSSMSSSNSSSFFSSNTSLSSRSSSSNDDSSDSETNEPPRKYARR